jgi:hypothetical protein
MFSCVIIVQLTCRGAVINNFVVLWMQFSRFRVLQLVSRNVLFLIWHSNNKNNN